MIARSDEPCLVTGGAGFIGSHLVQALSAARRPVRVLDNLSSGRRENLPPGADFVEGDLGDAAAVARAVAGAGVVFHLAAVASVVQSINRPLECDAVNVGGTLAILRAAAKAGARRVVFASSTAVYGDAAPPLAEDAPKRPLSPYAASKLGGELLCAAAAQHFGVEAVSLRFFNVYGPRQDPRSTYAAVIPLFIERLLAGRPLVVHGDGTQTRDFIYVDDVVAALRRAAEAPGASGRAYNVATGRAIGVGDLAYVIGRAAGATPQVEFGPPRAGDIHDSWADVTVAEREFGFRAATPLADGLRATVDWFRRSP